MTSEPTVDLTNCDREPIHVPGSIQPHGALLACEGPDLRVFQVSANAGDILGRPLPELLDRSLEQLVTAGSWQHIQRAAAADFPRELNPHRVETRDGRRFDGILHRSVTRDAVIVELEPDRGDSLGFHPRIRASVRRMQGARNKSELCDVAAQELRDLTGFDRVMVYRFDRDWNGEVVAEARRDDLEPFLGLHYPAADIPAQARRLYTVNWLRIIPDVAYRPAPLVPALGAADGGPLDLSFSVLRSVSPIHIEYLKNMHVTASMSVSLVREGVLIGLVACHHYSGAHFVSFIGRETAEHLGQTLSWHIAAFEAREEAERQVATQSAESEIVAAIATSQSIAGGLSIPALLALTSAQGAAVLYEGRVHSIGHTPSPDDIQKIVDLIVPIDDTWLYVTDRLGDVLPEAQQWEESAAGVMGMEISRDLREYVLWFRPATDRTVDWAGDPRKHEVRDDSGAPRLSPRGSFALWRQTVQGRSLPWESWQIEAASALRRVLLAGIRRRADELRLTNERLAEADRLKDEFLATVGHELRTPLNAMLGWVQVLRTGEVSDERRDRALATIERNARAQGKLVDDLLDVSRIVAGKLKLAMQPLEIGSLVDRAVEAMRPGADAKQIRIQCALDSTAVILGDAFRLQQVAANLLTNAVKFTGKGGRIQVFVERRDSSVDFTVADTGQGIAPDFLPHVFERFRQGDGGVARKSSGLGLGLAIVRNIVELHGGSVSVRSDGEGQGATFIVRLPLSIASSRSGQSAIQAAKGDRSLDCPPELKGARVLIVDDDPDARDVMKLLLEQCEAVVASAGSAADALQLVASFKPDVIVSDVGMPTVDGYGFVQRLRRLADTEGGRTPAVALTAHARVEDRARALYAGFNNHVPKPVEPVELFAVLTSLISRRA